MWVWIAAGTVVVLALAILSSRRPAAPPGAEPDPATDRGGRVDSGGDPGWAGGQAEPHAARLLRSRSGGAGVVPEAVVADKVAAFARGRLQLAEDYARHLGIAVPANVEQFLLAAGGGNWDEVKTLFNTLSAEREQRRGEAEFEALWPLVRETYGVSQAAQSWPAGELLNYGESLLASLAPGTVYIAGSDDARYVPMLMGETGGGDRPVILPQNALADASQLDYLAYLHGGRLTTLSRDDLQQVFSDLVQERAASPGSEGGGAVTVPGPAVVAGVNEKLLRLLMERNPALPFAMEQSVAMPELTAQAMPLGPILELPAGGATAVGVEARAAGSLQFWQDTAQRLQADGSLPPDAPARAAYAQLATGQAALLARQNLHAEAEQAYRLARDIAPGSPDAVGKLSQYLAERGRRAEAYQVIEDFSMLDEHYQFMADELRRAVDGASSAPGP